eukprot:scaffold7428_cov153-Amphora_coffeaeformis.AAC.2
MVYYYLSKTCSENPDMKSPSRQSTGNDNCRKVSFVSRVTASREIPVTWDRVARVVTEIGSNGAWCSFYYLTPHVETRNNVDEVQCDD